MALKYDGIWHSAVCDVCKDTFRDDDGYTHYADGCGLLMALDDAHWAYDGKHAYCPKHWRLVCSHCGRIATGASGALLAEGWLRHGDWYCPACVKKGDIWGTKTY